VLAAATVAVVIAVGVVIRPIGVHVRRRLALAAVLHRIATPVA
jgi:hypothetical protein